jgi:hypothetical protein
MLIMTGLMAVAIGAVIVLGRMVLDESKSQAQMRQIERREGRKPRGIPVQWWLSVALLMGAIALVWSASTWLRMVMALALRDQQLVWMGKGLFLMLLFSAIAIWLGNRLEQGSSVRLSSRSSGRGAATSSTLKSNRDSMTSIGRR